MVNKHKQIFDNYTQTVTPETISKWKDDIERWNRDHSAKPDPYEDVTTGIVQFIIVQS